jgi:hypothetical protein
LLTIGWLPRNRANTIEAKNAEFRAQPNVPIRRLRDRADPAFGEAVADFPRRMRVLADIERGV